MSIIGINEFKDDTLSFIRELSTDINLRSVLSVDQYKINSVIIDKARILAKVLKTGKANWDIAKAGADTTKAVADTSATKFAMKLKELRVKNALIVYEDAQGGMYAKLEAFNYELHGDFTQDNFVLSNLLDISKATFKMSGIKYLSEVHAKLKMDIDMDMANMKSHL